MLLYSQASLHLTVEKVEVRFGKSQKFFCDQETEFRQISLKNIVDASTGAKIKPSSKRYLTRAAILDDAGGQPHQLKMLEEENLLGEPLLVGLRDESGRTLASHLKLYPEEEARRGVEDLRFIRRQDTVRLTGASRLEGLGGKSLDDLIHIAQKSKIGLVVGRRLFLSQAQLERLRQKASPKSRRKPETEGDRWGHVFQVRDRLSSTMEAEAPKDNADQMAQEVGDAFDLLFSNSMLEQAEKLSTHLVRLRPTKSRHKKILSAALRLKACFQQKDARAAVRETVSEITGSD